MCVYSTEHYGYMCVVDTSIVTFDLESISRVRFDSQGNHGDGLILRRDQAPEL